MLILCKAKSLNDKNEASYDENGQADSLGLFGGRGALQQQCIVVIILGIICVCKFTMFFHIVLKAFPISTILAERWSVYTNG